MLVWSLVCTFMVLVLVAGVEQLMSAIGDHLGIEFGSFRYTLVCGLASVGFVMGASLLATRFYEARLVWSADLPLSASGFVDALILAQGIAVSVFLSVRFLARRLVEV